MATESLASIKFDGTVLLLFLNSIKKGSEDQRTLTFKVRALVVFPLLYYFSLYLFFMLNLLLFIASFNCFCKTLLGSLLFLYCSSHTLIVNFHLFCFLQLYQFAN